MAGLCPLIEMRQKGLWKWAWYLVFFLLPLRLSDWAVLGSVGSNAVRDFTGAAGAKHSPTTVEDWVQLKFGLFLQTQLVRGSETSEG